MNFKALVTLVFIGLLSSAADAACCYSKRDCSNFPGVDCYENSDCYMLQGAGSCEFNVLSTDPSMNNYTPQKRVRVNYLKPSKDDVVDQSASAIESSNRIASSEKNFGNLDNLFETCRPMSVKK